MVAISGALSKAKYSSAGAANRNLTIPHRNKDAQTSQPKFGQQSLVTAVAAPVGPSSVMRSARGVRLKFGSSARAP